MAQNLSITELNNLQNLTNLDDVEMYLNTKGWELTNVQDNDLTFGYDVDFDTKNSTYLLNIKQNENGNTLLILSDLKKYNQYLQLVTKFAKSSCRKNKIDRTIRVYQNQKTYIFQTTLDNNRNVYSLTILSNKQFEEFYDLCD